MTENIFHKGEKITIRTMLVVIFFALAKGIAGILSGSIVLTADAIHSAADSFSTFLVWIGLKIAHKKPTERFQYGYYKAENLSTLLVAALIFYAGFEIVKESIIKLFTSYQLHIPLIAMSVALLDAIVMFLVGSYEVRIGRRIHAQSLIADGSESRMHLFSSSVVLLGLLSSYFKIPYLEGIAGIVISFFVFSISWESGRDSTLALMDVSPNPEIEKKIKKILRAQGEVQKLSGLRLRKSGPFVFGEAEIKTAKTVRVERLHEIVEEIQDRIKKEAPQVDSFLVHAEPLEKSKRKIIIPVQEKRGTKTLLSPIFSKSRFFAILEVKKNKLESIRFSKNPFCTKKLRAGLSVASYLLKEKPDILITQEMGPIAFHTLRDHLVEIYQTEQKTIQGALKDFLERRLERLREPTKAKQ